jgi:tripartite-type tricarboxylate transporter receptor subunit TctC
MMKTILAGVLLASIATGSALAQPFPSKPVRMVVAFPPAGPVDIVARLIAPNLTEVLGKSVVVENRTGASGNLATAEVKKAPADGYTILAHSSGYAINPSLTPDAAYDAEKDFVAIAIPASQPNLIVVHSDFPAKTLAELLQTARARRLAYASPSSGTTPHLTAENLFRVIAKVEITHVPFRGAGPAVAAVVGGEPPIASLAASGPMPHLKSGKLRALAVSASRRLATLPDVPTLKELGYPGVEDYTWVGLFAPAGTPAAVVQKLNEAVNRAVQNQQVRERLEALAFEPVSRTPRQSAEYLRGEVAKWARVVRETGAKAE